MSATRTLSTLHDLLQYAATSPYRFVFLRNTYDPIARALKSRDTEDCRSQLESWFRLKLREAQYIQVAVGSSIIIFNNVTNLIVVSVGYNPVCLNRSCAVMASHHRHPLVRAGSVVCGNPSIAAERHTRRATGMAPTSGHQHRRCRKIQGKVTIFAPAHGVRVPSTNDVHLLGYRLLPGGVDRLRC